MRYMNELNIDTKSGFAIAMIRDGETFQCETRRHAAFKSKAYRDDDTNQLTFRDEVGGIVQVCEITKLFRIEQRF